MTWQECKRCRRKILALRVGPPAHEGYCGDCFEIVTGKCADCNGTGRIERAHLGTLECPRCEGSGQAPQAGAGTGG